MPGISILFKNGEEGKATLQKNQDHVSDLNLDQIIDEVISGYGDYDLEPFFYAPLKSSEDIKYRQAVFKDLEDDDLLKQIKSFAQKMTDKRRFLSLKDRLKCKQNKEGWFLHAVETYCEAVADLAQNLSEKALSSEGLISFRDYLLSYVDSDYFNYLRKETATIKEQLSEVKYCLHIKGTRISVQKYEGETDYSAELENTFLRFRHADVESYLSNFTEDAGMNHVEAQISDFVARLYPEIFNKLAEFCEHNNDFVDEKVAAFDREVQFYIAYLDHISSLKRTGLNFCYPGISVEAKEIYSCDGFDLALAGKLGLKGPEIICNDFYLTGDERIIVVAGPNQGGKTTFARSFGQLHYLAALGCPVPGREAQLFLFDRIFTHFEREEEIKDLRGKLEDDLARVSQIMSEATPQSIVILNEIFNSTTLMDEVFLSKKVLEKMLKVDLIGIFVTFVDELAGINRKTVSMASSTDPDDPSLKTFKFERRPPEGLAHAISIAEKYGLTYERIKERMSQ